jgi:hypothetical protein
MIGEAVGAALPVLPVGRHPLGHVGERLGAQPARPPLRLPPPRDQPGAFQHLQGLGHLTTLLINQGGEVSAKRLLSTLRILD